MGFCSPSIAQEAKPGQFVHIRCGESPFPLLRRPFSIHRVGREKVEILYRVVGWGTRLLSEKKEGGKIDVLGPLGRDFFIPEDNSRIILVAGGIGIAPLYFLTRWLRERKKEEVEIELFWGGKKKEELFLLDDFERLGVELHLATEDGSLGFRGKISELFWGTFKKFKSLEKTSFYGCGPRGMFKEIASGLEKENIFFQVSLEEWMGCGLGVCRGCVVRVRKNKGKIYQRVCKEGPVFNLKEVIW